jgi:hypothetical protein
MLVVSRLNYSRNFNVPDQGPSRGEYFRSHRDYRDALQGGTTHTSYGVGYGSMYPQALQSSSRQPGTSAGYDKAPHASRQSPISPSFVRQQSPRQMNLARSSSQGSAGAWNSLAGSFSHQSTSESHSPYRNNPGGFRVVCQQKPRPIAAAPPSQGHAGVQNAWVPFSQAYLNFTTIPAKKREALVVCNGQTEYSARILIPMGIKDWDQLLPTSGPRLQVTTLH